MKSTLSSISHIHCIGIGGIGISAISRMMLSEGKKVSGSDSSSTIITLELQKLGVVFFSELKASNISDTVDFVVYTTAIAEDNEELAEAKKRNIPVLTYPQMLGLISESMSTIAIAGTHGKTTTTAMVATMLIVANRHPKVIVGSLLKGYNSNYIPGNENIFVVEACEYRRSFLNLKPHILIITNIDVDHLDYYKDLEDIQSAFIELSSKMDSSDFLICDTDEANVLPIIQNTKATVIDRKNTITLNLKVPGQHNIQNAYGALKVGTILGIEESILVKGLETFDGTWRRFEYKKTTENGTLIYDDYAHHPTEIKATLEGARSAFPHKKIIAIFQPHLFSRTKLLLEDFAAAFNDVDEVIVAPIYAAREKLDPTINSEMLKDAINKNSSIAKCFDTFPQIAKYVASQADDQTLVITLGAGDIYKVVDLL